MRSRLLACIAVALVSVCPRLVSEARAANPKSKGADKKAPTELHADDKSMKKQMQWEDKVMGPDSTRADLARIARAHALNEKAIKEQAARDAAAPPPPVVAKSAPKRADVALPSVSDGAAPKKTDGDGARTQISPKLASDEAKALPPAVKPADDKFIDKLLHAEQESTANNKKKSSASDRDLDRLLAGANEKHSRRGDDVDKLIKGADSGPAMPAPRAQSALPAWTQQPDISPTPAVAVVAPPVVAKPAKKNDGVIRVVQGSTGIAPTASAPAETAPSRAARPSRAPASRSASNGSNWNDPFAAESPAGSTSTPRKASASRPAAASSEWSDPFADKSDAKTTRRPPSSSAAPASTPAPKHGDKNADPAAHPPGWKDPFTKAPAAASPPPVAMRELGRTENAKWELASHRAAPKVSSADAHSGWGVIKKRGR
jgi:hypothetical protein